MTPCCSSSPRLEIVESTLEQEKFDQPHCPGRGEDTGGEMELRVLIRARRHVRALVGSRVGCSQQGRLLQTDDKVVHTGWGNLLTSIKLHIRLLQLCCFPVCIVSWLASYTHFGEGGRDGGKAGDGVTPFQVKNVFLGDMAPFWHRLLIGSWT